MDVRDLPVNESPYILDDISLTKQRCGNKNWSKSPFSVIKEFNDKVVVYNGKLRDLSAEAFINPTNESLSQLDPIVELAGPEFQTYVKRKIFQCPTGSVKVAPGFKSNFKHILLAVPPKYQSKYKTAAETALFHTYFRLLETLITKKIRTVVMPTLSTVKCNLPFEDNFNMQIRIIRRMLEKKSNHFDRIVVLIPEDEKFASPFFWYFPTSNVDEELACYKLDCQIGGPNGEPVIPEREIRIKSKPTSLGFDEGSVDLTSGLDLSTVVGKTSFSKMRGDFETSKNRSPNNQVAIRKSVFRTCTLL